MGNLSRLVESLRDRGILDSAEMERLLMELRVSVEELRDHIREDRERYNRAHIFRNDHCELLCLTWLPGQQSPIHGHGPTLGSVTVVSGQVFERVYRVGGRRAFLAESRVVRAGEVFRTEGGLVHQVGNAANDEVLITLHLYSPPLSGPTPETFEEGEPSVPPGAPGSVVQHGH